MEIEIKVLEVGDADSILITLSKKGETFLMLIDGGRSNSFEKVKKEIDYLFSKYHKNSIDLVVCTHYDSDHIEGLIKLVEAGYSVDKLWAFDTQQLLSAVSTQPDFEKMFPSESDDLIGGEVNTREKEVYGTLITSVLQEKELLEKARERNILPEEPLAGLSIKGWEEIQVIGPSKEYYEKLFPRTYRYEDLKEDVSIQSRIEDLGETTDPCESLHAKESKISKVNLNSAIILITANEKKYLFAADAGIDSFYAIPKLNELLKDIHWFKCPHHGSKNNLNVDILRLLKPKVVAVSGDRRISDNLIHCLKLNGSDVFITKTDGDLLFVNGNYQP